MVESPNTGGMFILLSIGDLAAVLGPLVLGPLCFCCRRMSPVGKDGHGYDGCTCKEKIVERDLLLWYVCIRGGGLLHLNLAVIFGLFTGVLWRRGKSLLFATCSTLISSAEFPFLKWQQCV